MRRDNIIPITYYAIFVFVYCQWHMSSFLPLSIVRKDIRDEFFDRMFLNVDTPTQLRDSVVYNLPPQMTLSLESKPTTDTRAADAGASSLRDRICGMVNMRYRRNGGQGQVQTFGRQSFTRRFERDSRDAKSGPEQSSKGASKRMAGQPYVRSRVKHREVCK